MFLIVTLNIALVISIAALVMTLINLRCYRPPPEPEEGRGEDAVLVSVCIPARNEAANIEACLRAILAGTHAAIEVLVYDDHSSDGTGDIVRRITAEDERVQCVPIQPLPAGWNGKQFACDVMGRLARGEWIIFTDADVRFEPSCIDRAMAAASRSRTDLISTFPKQLTRSFGEALLLPMILFVLMSYLPMPRMRRTRDPAASAGCGQFLMARRDAYLASGGHAAFRDSMHDGIMMPRAFRRQGFHTDLFDGTCLLSVRMYAGFAAAWRGFAKNAYEGLGSIWLLIFLTVTHGLGHVLPWLFVARGLSLGEVRSAAFALAATCVLLQIAQRFVLARRFDQARGVILLHPLSVTMMTLIQWHSLYLCLTGRRKWRGRIAGQPINA